MGRALLAVDHGQWRRGRFGRGRATFPSDLPRKESWAQVSNASSIARAQWLISSRALSASALLSLIAAAANRLDIQKIIHIQVFVRCTQLTAHEPSLLGCWGDAVGLPVAASNRIEVIPPKISNAPSLLGCWGDAGGLFVAASNRIGG